MGVDTSKAQETERVSSVGRRLTEAEIEELLRGYDEAEGQLEQTQKEVLATFMDMVPPFESSAYYLGVWEGMILCRSLVLNFTVSTMAFEQTAMLMGLAVSKFYRDAVKVERGEA
jgi:hypothetical protein